MKEIELMLEAAKTISNDKIIDAVQFTIRVEAVGNFLVTATLMFCCGYFLYKIFNRNGR